MKQTYKGTYPLNGIKYFTPEGITIKLRCPHCNRTIEVDMSDLLEYPESEQLIDWVECDCEEVIPFQLSIRLLVEMDVE